LADPIHYDAIVPAFNAAATLSETLRSILGQTLKPNQIFVIDDGSTDHTAQIAASFGNVVTLYSQENLGPGAATTAGIALSTAPMIATLDADDLWLNDKMAAQLAHLEHYPHCDAVFGKLQPFREGKPIGPVENGWTRSTMVVRRSVFFTVGAIIDPPGKRGEMIDWISKARFAGYNFEMLDKLVSQRRIHPGSLTFRRSTEADSAYLYVARQAILRRRSKNEPYLPKEMP
jgi:glycosyltransferase involved in cell wall biosynthesis